MGRVTARTYPSLPANQGPSFTYQYDLMGQMNTLAQNGTQQVSATYGVANELTSLTYYGYTETRSYNSLFQLTRQTVAGVFDTEYVFPTGQNNGQISASIDHISGQQVNYTYDLLKRLTAAATTGGTPWGEAYTYDGFGNLNAATVTQGSGVNWANASDPATNRLIGVPYDANGNNTTPLGPCCTTAYDAENRMVSQSTSSAWTYDPSNKRVAQANTYTWTLYFYDIFGKQIETVAGDVDYPNTPTTGTTNVYFGSKMIQAAGVTVVTDRLGSVRANSNGERFTYLPYGTEQTPTADGRVKFGTYFRDSTSPAQDYADQRYYNPWYGRFNTPDPIGSKAAAPSNPSSWNMYAYTGGDPVNRNDPMGTYDDGPSLEAPSGWDWGGGGGGGCDPFWDAWCGDPCGNSFLPNPACPYQGPTPSPDTGPQPPPPPQLCTVSVFGQSAVFDNDLFRHTYTEVLSVGQSPAQAQFLEAEPIAKDPNKNGKLDPKWLNGFDTTGHPLSTNGSTLLGSMVESQSVCDKLISLEAGYEKDHNNTITYNNGNPWAGPTSNSWTHSLLNAAGIGGIVPGLSNSRYPGWSNTGVPFP
jgi:RHS repeat-associated protein